jgi:hypothetical protein
MDSIKKILRPFYLPVTNKYHQVFIAAKRYHHLFDEIESKKAISILEVGTWNGERAVKMIEKAQLNTDKKVTYIGFDLFEGLSDDLYKEELSKKPPTFDEVKNKLEATNANITLIKGNTINTLPEFIKGGEKVDFIFIDGGHSVDTIQSDWDAVSKLMHENTVVIFDDYWRNREEESAGPVVNSIDKTKYTVEILPEIDKFNNPDFGRLEISFAKVSKY